MEYNDFYNNIRFTNLSDYMQKTITQLINNFENQGYQFSLEWREYSGKTKQFTLKNANLEYGVNVVITATVNESCIKIEVHNGFYNVKNKFKYTYNIEKRELDKLYKDIYETLGIN